MRFLVFPVEPKVGKRTKASSLSSGLRLGVTTGIRFVFPRVGCNYTISTHLS